MEEYETYYFDHYANDEAYWDYLMKIAEDYVEEDLENM